MCCKAPETFRMLSDNHTNTRYFVILLCKFHIMICDDVMCVQKHKIWSVLQVIGSYFPFQMVLLTVDQNCKVKQVNLVS